MGAVTVPASDQDTTTEGTLDEGPLALDKRTMAFLGSS